MTTNGVFNNVVKKLKNFLHIQQNHCGTSCMVYKHSKWDVNELICDKSRKNSKYAVIILNRPITQNQEFMKKFWNSATVRITVDGGTVHWDQFYSRLPLDTQKQMKVPDLITGDFDSITEEVTKKYKNKGCKMVHTPDDRYTDFTKALIELRDYSQQNSTEIHNIVAVCQSSGRLDQILGNIQTMFLAKDQNILSKNTNVFLLSDDAISWLLRPGDHAINIPEHSRKHRRAWCSLVPIGEMCESVTTSGLKWNLLDQPLKFGELVSTSNTFDGSELVKINCSHTILWSMRIPNVGGQYNHQAP